MNAMLRIGLAAVGGAVAGCDLPVRRPPFAREEAPWLLLAANESTAVSLDTANIIRATDGTLRIQMRYEFARPIKVPGRPGSYAWRVESVERPQCDSLVAHPLSIVLYDSVGKEVVRGWASPGSESASMIGPLARPLCRYLEKRRRAGRAD